MSTIREEAKYKGKLSIHHFNENGALIQEVTKDNLIVNAGVAYFASRNISNSVAAISHMAMGTTSTAPAVANTVLGAELSRAVTTNSITTTTLTGDTATFVSTFGAGIATGALTEAGLFNASSGGSMISRIVFPVINKGANDSIVATWAIQSK
jgi:hypothetical protein